MIRFSLACDRRHDFEAWFGSNADFEAQKERELVTCPVCGSASVEKALMTPAVSHGGERKDAVLALDPQKQEMMKALREMVKTVRANSEDVGERFPEEARRIHHGETEERGIIGKASGEEVRALLDEGIEVAPLPEFPEERN